MSDECKAIIDFLGCEYELIKNGKSGYVMERFRALTEQGAAEGFFPLMIVPSDTLLDSLEIGAEEAEGEDSAARRDAVLRAAQDINAQKVFAQQMEERELDEDELEEMLGDFDASDFFSDGFGMGEPELLIAKIPAKHPWELAAWVPMGGFNECPLPEEQAAVFRYWYEKYSAIPRLVTFDIWEMNVAKPPRTQAEAEALAKEQYAFCPDIVAQGTETIRALASGLINSPVWQFWWD